MLWRDTNFLLGVPVDRLTLGEALGRIFALMHEHHADHRPRTVVSASVDVLYGALSVFRSTPRHPRLLSVMRGADLVLADSLPLIRLTRLFGPPLPARVKGADLFPVLIREAVRRQYAIYLLGPDLPSVQVVQQTIQLWFPEAKIVGADWTDPMDFGKTTPATPAERALSERINRSCAQLLIVGFGFGHLKQERWLQRCLPMLHVPLTVALGGIFDTYANSRCYQPLWVAAWHLGWLFDLLVHPRRFWKERVKDWLALSLLSIPWLVVYSASRHLPRWGCRDNAATPLDPRQAVHTTPSARGQVVTLTTPSLLDRTAVMLLAERVLERLNGASALIIDARQLGQLDAAGIGFLATLHADCARHDIHFHGFGLRKTSIRLLQAARAWDLLGPAFHAELPDVVATMAREWGGNGFCLASIAPVGADRAVLRVFGQMRSYLLAPVQDRILSIWDGELRELELDLQGCIEIDDDAARTLAGWQAHFLAVGRRLLVTGLLPALEGRIPTPPASVPA